MREKYIKSEIERDTERHREGESNRQTNRLNRQTDSKPQNERERVKTKLSPVTIN